MRPHEIEEQSFRIIEAEAGAHGFSADEWQIVRRMIHTSADFDYLRSVRLHPQAISGGLGPFAAAGPSLADTHMAAAGIRKPDAARFGVSVRCYIDDPAVHVAARNAGTTRAAAAVDTAAAAMPDGIYVIGNAPTALQRLIELVRSGQVRPALIVGLPVGFVNAAESKTALTELNHPFITNQGRKGGSNVAAAVVNALLLLAR